MFFENFHEDFFVLSVYLNLMHARPSHFASFISTAVTWLTWGIGTPKVVLRSIISYYTYMKFPFCSLDLNVCQSQNLSYTLSTINLLVHATIPRFITSAGKKMHMKRGFLEIARIPSYGRQGWRCTLDNPDVTFRAAWRGPQLRGPKPLSCPCHFLLWSYPFPVKLASISIKI